MQTSDQTNRGTPEPLEHPSREEWMAWLYAETEQATAASLRVHLENCASCRARVSEWRDAMTSLNSWQLPLQWAPRRPTTSALKWGIAALFILSCGYGLGHFTAATANEQRLQARIDRSLGGSVLPALREQFRKELSEEVRARLASAQRTLTTEGRDQFETQFNSVAEKTFDAASDEFRRLLAEYAERQERQNELLFTALRNLDVRQSRQAANHAALRGELETVAVLTEKSFRQAQQDMVQLAGYTTADAPPDAIRNDGSRHPNSRNP